MLNKVVLAAAIAVKLAMLGIAAQFFAAAPVSSEPTLQADCPWCQPYPQCWPGDPCNYCG
jgi:hypothetical protein